MYGVYCTHLKLVNAYPHKCFAATSCSCQRYKLNALNTVREVPALLTIETTSCINNISFKYTQLNELTSTTTLGF